MTKPLEKCNGPVYLPTDELSSFVRKLRNFNKTEVYRVLRIKSPNQLAEIQKLAANDKIISKVINQILTEN